MNIGTVCCFILCALLICGQTNAEPSVTVETLLQTISEGEGRQVYEAFQAIPSVADTTEKQTKAFEGLSIYLGQANKYFIVRDWFPPRHKKSENQFAYSELAASTIIALGEPGRAGLVDLLTDDSKPASEHAAITLCQIQATAIRLKDQPESDDFPPLDADKREALGTFLKQRSDSLSVSSLTAFYAAGFHTAAGYMHDILITSPDEREKHRAVIYLGSYGYEPALDDLLRIFQETPDKGLRGSIREKLAYFTDSERVILALTNIMEGTTNEDLRKECRVALELVRLKAEWRKRQNEKNQ